MEYPSGRRDNVDVCVRRAVLSSVNKSCCDIQLDLANEVGSRYVEVTAHIGARPSHAEWQGQIYCLERGDPKYPYFYEATGYGTGDGLGGWNCRHNFFPYFDGIDTPYHTPEFSKTENNEYYALTQKQRGYERAVRDSKRKLAALDGARQSAEDPALKAKLDRDFARRAVTLKKREARLEKFIKDNDLQRDNSRVRVAGFGKSVSRKTVWAEKNYGIHRISFASNTGLPQNNSQNPLTSASNGSIITPSYKFTEETSPKFRSAFNAQYDKAVKIFGEITTIDTVGVLHVPTESGVYGEYSDNTRILKIRNADKNNFISIMTDICKNHKDSGEWATNNARHTIRHEIGHAIFLQHEKTDSDWFDKKQKLYQLFDMYSLSNKTIDNQLRKDTLSIYGFDTYKEMVSECIAEYLDGNLRNFAERVVNIILKGEDIVE